MSHFLQFLVHRVGVLVNHDLLHLAKTQWLHDLHHLPRLIVDALDLLHHPEFRRLAWNDHLIHCLLGSLIAPLQNEQGLPEMGLRKLHMTRHRWSCAFSPISHTKQHSRKWEAEFEHKQLAFCSKLTSTKKLATQGLTASTSRRVTSPSLEHSDPRLDDVDAIFLRPWWYCRTLTQTPLKLLARGVSQARSPTQYSAVSCLCLFSLPPSPPPPPPPPPLSLSLSLFHLFYTLHFCQGLCPNNCHFCQYPILEVNHNLICPWHSGIWLITGWPTGRQEERREREREREKRELKSAIGADWFAQLRSDNRIHTHCTSMNTYYVGNLDKSNNSTEMKCWVKKDRGRQEEKKYASSSSPERKQRRRKQNGRRWDKSETTKKNSLH